MNCEPEPRADIEEVIKGQQGGPSQPESTKLPTLFRISHLKSVGILLVFQHVTCYHLWVLKILFYWFLNIW